MLAILSLACAKSGEIATPEESSVVYADPFIEAMYQLAKDSNPQMTYTDAEYRQMFFDWYGGEEAQSIAADAFLQASNEEIGYVKAGDIVAVLSKNPQHWLYALAAYVGVNTIIAMNAEQIANLSLPTIDIKPQRFVVPQWFNTPAPVVALPPMEVPQGFIIDTNPIKGSSVGQVENKYDGTAWVFMSFSHYCHFWIDSSMPKADWSKLERFEEKFEKDGPCNILDIIHQMLKVGKRAVEAGVSADFIRQFYIDVFSKIVTDLKLPFSGDTIVKMLGM